MFADFLDQSEKVAVRWKVLPRDSAFALLISEFIRIGDRFFRHSILHLKVGRVFAVAREVGS